MLELIERSLSTEYLKLLKEHKSWEMLKRVLEKSKELMVTITPKTETQTAMVTFESKNLTTIIIHLDNA